MSEVDSAVCITRYINPHCFYYKPLTLLVQEHEQTQFADALNKHCETAYGELYRAVRKPQPWEVQPPGTLVVLLSIQLERWIRCMVEESVQDMNGNTWYQLWAIDEGIAIKSDPKYVRPLPEAFAQEPPHTKRGALINVLPTDTRFDYLQNELIQEPSNQWCPGIVNTLQVWLDAAVGVRMVEKAKLTWKGETIHLGELYVTSQNNTLSNMTDLLQKACPKQIMVAPAAGFIKAFVKLHTIDMKRYLNNEGLFDMHVVNNFVDKFPRDNTSPHDKCHNENESGRNSELKQKVHEWLRRNQEDCLAMLQNQREQENQQKIPEILNLTAECIMSREKKNAYPRPKAAVATKNSIEGVEKKEIKENAANPTAESSNETGKSQVLACRKPSSLLLNLQRRKARMLNAASAQ